MLDTEPDPEQIRRFRLNVAVLVMLSFNRGFLLLFAIGYIFVALIKFTARGLMKLINKGTDTR